MNLLEQIIEHALNQELTGIVLVDNLILDAIDDNRMATSEELEELKRAA